MSQTPFQKQRDWGFGAALHSLEAIMCHKFLSLIVLANDLNMILFHICRFTHLFNEAFGTLILYLSLLIVVEVKNATSSGVLKQMEISKAGEHG
jgi:hypothetical protein